MYAFQYHRPQSVADAAKLLASNSEAKLLAGGHTLRPDHEACGWQARKPSSTSAASRELKGIDKKRQRARHRRHDDARRGGEFRGGALGHSPASPTWPA